MTYVLVDTLETAIEPLLRLWRTKASQTLSAVVKSILTGILEKHTPTTLGRTFGIAVVGILLVHSATVLPHRLQLGTVKHLRQILELVFLVLLLFFSCSFRVLVSLDHPL
ncbi:hypothetical protein KC325_g202 [Hortaea werneckii]|nr:hypothetical protein KC325_g202 [Hortaea werneckii]